jgi:hypothetical protein
MLPRHRTASPETLLQAITPSRAALGVAVACLCPWDWPADLGAPEGLPCVRGHARALQALQGGQATHDTLAAHTMAVVLRGGRLPQADVAPAARRAPCARLRRRRSLPRQRAARLAHL